MSIPPITDFTCLENNFEEDKSIFRIYISNFASKCDYGAVIRAGDSLVQAYPTNKDAERERVAVYAWTACQLKVYDVALEAIKQVLQDEPKNQFYLRKRAEILEIQEKEARMLSSFQLDLDQEESVFDQIETVADFENSFLDV